MTDRTVLFIDEPCALGASVTLSENEAHHLRVVRIGVGERVGLRDGAGTIASGTLVRVTKSQAVVEVDNIVHVDPIAPVHLLVPVADRDRMLWLAEKVAELNVASWRPVLWHRSKSVSPRGDGPTFRAKVRARMVSALLQSRSAWLPELFPESTPEAAIAAAPVGARFVCDATGQPMLEAVNSIQSPITLAIGPEGGFEPGELSRLVDAGFVCVTLGRSVLRFETAAVASIAVARSMLLANAAETLRIENT